MRTQSIKRTFPKGALYSMLFVFPLIFLFIFAVALFAFASLYEISLKDSFYTILSFYTPTRLLYVSAIVALLSLQYLKRRSRGYKNLHGSARWSSLRELSWKGYTRHKSGFVLGAASGRILRSWKDEHIFFVAPTRSGKSVSMSIPTLLSNEHNIFVLDIKGELYEKTSLYREYFLNQKIILLDPAHPKTQQFNPLESIDIGVNSLADIGRIAAILYPPIGGDGQMWQDLAKNLFTYSVYYLVLKHHGEGKAAPTLADVNNLWSDDIEEIEQEIEQVCENNTGILLHDTEGQIINEMRQFASTTEKARSSILTTFVSALKLFIEPQVRAFTSKTTLNFDDFIYHPATIYFSVKPNDLARLAPLINMFLELILNQLARQMDDKRRLIYFLLDEFTSIGKVQTIAKALAYLASYKVRFAFIVQNLAQLKHLYKDEMQVIISNCAVQLYAAVSEPDTQRHILSLLGDQTILVKRAEGDVHEVKRPLLTMEEISNLQGINNKRGKIQPGQLILVINNMNPFLCGRVIYFKLKEFTEKIFERREYEFVAPPVGAWIETERREENMQEKRRQDHQLEGKEMSDELEQQFEEDAL